MIFYEIDPSNRGALEVPFWVAIMTVVLYVAFYVTFYVLRSLGVYKLAKNNNINKAYLAFIPGVWLYPACKLLSDSRFFRTTIGRVALVFTIIFSVATFGKLIIDTILYIPLVSYYLGGLNKGAIILFSSQESVAGYTPYIVGDIFVLTETYNPVYPVVFLRILSVFDYVIYFFDMAGGIIAIFVYFALFRKFSPANHVLFAILSAFGLFAPLVFAVRNKKPVDYNTFIRSRMGYGNYGNPYNQGQYNGGQYNGGQYNGGYAQNQTPPQEPFEDFDKKEEPFEDFGSEKKNNDKNSNDPFDEFN